MAYRVLEVTLQSAKNLKRVNLISRMEVYAVVTISGDPLTRQCTQPDPSGGRHPIWNTTFRFNVPPTASAANGCLHVLLRTERALGDRDVGEVILPLSDVLAGTTDCDPLPRPQQCASLTVRKLHRFEPRGTLKLSYRLGPVVAPQKAPPPAAAASGDAHGPVVAYPVPPLPFYHQPYAAAYLPYDHAVRQPAPSAGRTNAAYDGVPAYSQDAGHGAAVRQPAATSAGATSAYNTPAYSQAAAGHGAGHQPAPSAGPIDKYDVTGYPQAAAGHGAAVRQPAASAGATSAYNTPAYSPAAAGHGAAVRQPAASAGATSAYNTPAYSPAAAGHGAGHQPVPSAGPIDTYDITGYPQAAAGHGAARQPAASGHGVPAYSQAAGGYAAPSPAKGKTSDGGLEFGTGLGAGLVTGAISGMLASDAVAYSYGYRAGLADGGAAYNYKNSHVPTKVQDKAESNWKMV